MNTGLCPFVDQYVCKYILYKIGLRIKCFKEMCEIIEKLQGVSGEKEFEFMKMIHSFTFFLIL